MLPKIKKAAETLAKAEANMKAVLASEQKKCPHKQVIHSKWRSSEWGPAFKARRLCLDCGLEEQAMYSGWGDSDNDFKRLKTGGFHKEVDGWTLYGKRFPQADVGAT